MNRPLLQLLRPPNLFTVPGDPLCGALLATGGQWSWRIVPCMLISLAAYCAGLVINDLADYKEDLRERPARPLPSGAVSVPAAQYLAIALITVALLTAVCVSLPVFYTTAVLINLILLYNLLAKKSGFFGPWVMGLCRGASVMVGISAVAPWHRNGGLPAAFIITIYIIGVSQLARGETSDPRIPPLIGRLIRGLLLVQAILCVYAGGIGTILAFVLLALLPVSRLVAKRFYAS